MILHSIQNYTDVFTNGSKVYLADWKVTYLCMYFSIWSPAFGICNQNTTFSTIKAGLCPPSCTRQRQCHQHQLGFSVNTLLILGGLGLLRLTGRQVCGFGHVEQPPQVSQLVGAVKVHGQLYRGWTAAQLCRHPLQDLRRGCMGESAILHAGRGRRAHWMGKVPKQDTPASHLKHQLLPTNSWQWERQQINKIYRIY